MLSRIFMSKIWNEGIGLESCDVAKDLPCLLGAQVTTYTANIKRLFLILQNLISHFDFLDKRDALCKQACLEVSHRPCCKRQIVFSFAVRRSCLRVLCNSEKSCYIRSSHVTQFKCRNLFIGLGSRIVSTITRVSKNIYFNMRVSTVDLMAFLPRSARLLAYTSRAGTCIREQHII